MILLINISIGLAKSTVYREYGMKEWLSNYANTIK